MVVEQQEGEKLCSWHIYEVSREAALKALLYIMAMAAACFAENSDLVAYNKWEYPRNEA